MSKVRRIKVRGRVISGVGKGKYYVSLRPYYALFSSILSAPPFLGTLNVTVENGVLNINNLPHTFCPSGYGEIKYALGELRGTKILVLRPCKSVHPQNVFEIVAPIEIRKWLRLRDGDEIEFDVYIIKEIEEENR